MAPRGLVICSQEQMKVWPRDRKLGLLTAPLSGVKRSANVHRNDQKKHFSVVRRLRSSVMWGSWRETCAPPPFGSHSSESCVPWAPGAPASAGCVWERLVLCDGPAAWERGAGILRTPCCSSGICFPATANGTTARGAATNLPVWRSFQRWRAQNKSQAPAP